MHRTRLGCSRAAIERNGPACLGRETLPPALKPHRRLTTLAAVPSTEQRWSDIKIRRSHSMPHDKARAAAEKMAKLLKKEFELDYEWAEDDQDVLVFERPGVNGELTVAPKHVEMEVKLGFLLRMMKPTIERHIHEHLDEIFAGHDKAKPKNP